MYNGFVVTYSDPEGESTYVYKATEDLQMWKEMAKRFLKRRIKIEEE